MICFSNNTIIVDSVFFESSPTSHANVLKCSFARHNSNSTPIFIVQNKSRLNEQSPSLLYNLAICHEYSFYKWRKVPFYDYLHVLL